MSTATIVRTVMRVVLIQEGFAKSQVPSFATWKKALEKALEKALGKALELLEPQLSVSDRDKCKYQISCFNSIIHL